MKHYLGIAFCLVGWSSHAQTQLPAIPSPTSPIQAVPLGQAPSRPDAFADAPVSRTRLGVKVGGALTTEVG